MRYLLLALAMGIVGSAVQASPPTACVNCRCHERGFPGCDCEQGDYCRCILISADASIDAEAVLNDGSRIRLVTPGDSIEIQTPYGKLAIPFGEIRRIDFGFHYPPGAKEKIDAAIKSLGASAFKERDAAERELMHIGPLTYRAASSALKSDNPEVVARVRKIVSRIEAAHSRDSLARDKDRISARDFTVIGTILAPSLAVKSSVLGDVVLPVASIRSMTFLGINSEANLKIEADGKWVDSGIDMDEFRKLTASASGQVDIWPQGAGQYVTGPNGFTTNAAGGLAFPAGSLLGKIEGDIFLIGDSWTGTKAGRLFLSVAPSPWNTPSTGSYAVRLNLQIK